MRNYKNRERLETDITWKRTESQASRKAFRIKAPMAITNAPIGHAINATVAAHNGWNIPSTKIFIKTFHVMAVNGLAPKTFKSL